MLFSKYGAGANHIMEMDFVLGCEYIATAIKNHEEDRVYMRWINGYQNMSYSEFKNQIGHTLKKEDNRTEESILDSVKNIINGNKIKKKAEV